MKAIPITMYAKIDDDTVHCDATCEFMRWNPAGTLPGWKHYCFLYDVALMYDDYAKKWWRCENCIANEGALEVQDQTQIIKQ